MKTLCLYLLFLVISGICVNVAFQQLDKQWTADQKTQMVISNEEPECLADNNY